MSTYHAAKALKLKNYGLQVGCLADLVVLDAPSPAAAIISQSAKTYVFKFGNQVATTQILSDSYFEEN
jgi:cytosine deaminase